MIVSWNGSLMESDQVRVPVTDAAYLRGEGFFETIRVSESRALFFGDHYRRLEESAKRFDYRLPSEEELLLRLKGVLEANELKEARVRVTLSENLLLTAVPMEPGVGGVSVVTDLNHPINEKSPLAGLKCTSYAENMALLRLHDHAEVLRPNTSGELCEGCISNVFFMKEGRLCTPSLETGCLPGVMRKQVIERVEVEEGRWPFEELFEADEIWLTNAIRKLRYVENLDGRAMPTPSELFQKLRLEIP